MHITPKQTVKLFELCEKILAIQMSVPAAPLEVPAEVVCGQLDLGPHADTLVELRDLLVQIAP